MDQAKTLGREQSLGQMIAGKNWSLRRITFSEAREDESESVTEVIFIQRDGSIRVATVTSQDLKRIFPEPSGPSTSQSKPRKKS